MVCDICNARVKELRRGRCWGCYTKWAESRPVGLGATCVMCGERRRDNLRSVELLGSWMPCCHTCAARIVRLEPLPQTLAGIRRALERDRRRASRRVGKPDTRVFPRERRTSDRRRPRAHDADDLLSIDDDMILEIEELEALAGEMSRPANDGDDLTRIRELPFAADG
ncbi:MAG: hypothetical protein D6689_15920 [Deltaproteobacteria bacterium]|nr:MAG: hypothetical protein D6689_15920 [Deltaproteobacteria bacterium]